ncbi:MAG: DUF445 family protein [Treponema sp.]|jgi:uncharacterized membrane-anchored protein YjiN (DUF445 family)|nr:DUF445 family protein [Treponema sp.]
MKLLTFLLPPLIGALIGFLTNVLAIRMLFRPLKEYRIFGIRIPFTPGILPRQRRRLALSIGGMVERELFTPQVIRERLGRTEVREAIRQQVSLYTEKIPEKFEAPGTLDGGGRFDGGGVPGGSLSGWIVSGAEELYPRFAAGLAGFLGRKDIREEIESRGQVLLLDAILKLNVFQRFFLQAGQYDRTLHEQIPALVDELIQNVEEFLREEETREKILSFLLESLKKTGRDLLIPGTGKKEKLDLFITERLLAAAEKEADAVLKTIDVKTMVAERIDALDMLKVEEIILDVMARQLKWIDIFGGILGFLIGLVQVVVSQFM